MEKIKNGKVIFWATVHILCFIVVSSLSLVIIVGLFWLVDYLKNNYGLAVKYTILVWFMSSAVSWATSFVVFRQAAKRFKVEYDFITIFVSFLGASLFYYVVSEYFLLGYGNIFSFGYLPTTLITGFYLLGVALGLRKKNETR